MESQEALLEVVEDQKNTIEKYSSKLRDVVAAYKGLLVEKKALEDAVKILQAEKVTTLNKENSDDEKTSDSIVRDSSETELKNKLSALVISMSNLVAEKSQMELGFKSKQKQLLEEKKEVENKFEELEEQVKTLTRQLNCLEIKNISENSQTNKNSQKSILSSKQITDKEKSKNTECELLALQVKNYEKEIKTLRSEIEAKQAVYESSERKLFETCQELTRLQEDFKNIQIEHEIAISNEKEKVKIVEEQTKKLNAVHERRIYNLEARIAELSETIGTYDRLSLQDQIEIKKLKEHITFLDVDSKVLVQESENAQTVDLNNYDSLKEKFLEILKHLRMAAQKHNKEGDLTNLLSENSNVEEMHLLCREEYAELKTEFECFKHEVGNFSEGKLGEVVGLQNQVKSLQNEIKVLSDEKSVTLNDYNLKIAQLETKLKNEMENSKKMISALEADHLAEVQLLEEQLKKQHERSSALLEEKNQDIQALQSTLQRSPPCCRRESAEESTYGPYIVHYANELARKDVEISSLRKRNHAIEMNLRKLKKQMLNFKHIKNQSDEYELLEQIASLKIYQAETRKNWDI